MWLCAHLARGLSQSSERGLSTYPGKGLWSLSFINIMVSAPLRGLEGGKCYVKNKKCRREGYIGSGIRERDGHEGHHVAGD